MTESAPDQPAGAFVPVQDYSDNIRIQLIDTIRMAPARLRESVAGLTDEQLDTKYRNWSIRQIVHHLPDSHLHSYVRFRWTLTEDEPTIKAYEEGDWCLLPDCQQGRIEPALLLTDGLHARWVQSLEAMTESDFARRFHHPQTDEHVSLWHALNYYAWHCHHHTAQIQWLTSQHGWS